MDILLFYFIMLVTVSKASLRPDLELEKTDCETFSKNARFNPYSVLNDTWIVFFYWGPPQDFVSYKFTVPTLKQDAYLHKILDGHVPAPINWGARRVLMVAHTNDTVLLVEKGDRGEFESYALYRGLKEGEFTDVYEVRLKQTGDNKILGMMFCAQNIVYALCRLSEVPPKNQLQNIASRVGYFGRGGKSYLYRGHEWMPIAEDDEEAFWDPDRYYHRMF